MPLPVTLSEAARVPMAEGTNEIAMVQLLSAGTGEPQVSASVKSVAFAPVTARLEMLKVALPLLLRVTT
jgi:hypothetical protein